MPQQLYALSNAISLSDLGAIKAALRKLAYDGNGSPCTNIRDAIRFALPPESEWPAEVKQAHDDLRSEFGRRWDYAGD